MFDISYLIIMSLVIFIQFYTATILSIRGKKQLLLGCVVTEEMKNNEKIKKLLKRYVTSNFMISIIAEIGIILSYFILSTPISIVSIFFAIFGTMISFGIYNEKLKGIKRELGGLKDKKQVVVYELEDYKYNKKILFSYLVISIPVILINLYLCITRYSMLPNKFPSNFDFRGNIIGYSNKNFFTVFGVILSMIILVCVFIFVDYLIQKQKLKIDPRNPEKSREGNLRYRNILSKMMFFTGTISIFMLVIGNLQVLQIISMNSILTGIIGILTVLLFIILVIFMVKAYKIRNDYKIENNDVVSKDDDDKWIFGFIYYNKDDPRVNVEKRFGIGYTVNAATKIGMAVYIMLGIVLIVALVLAFTQT